MLIDAGWCWLMLYDADWCWLLIGADWRWLMLIGTDWFSLTLIDDWCWLILNDADLCWLMLIDAGWCWLMLIDAGWCWLILVDADWLKHKWERFTGEKNAPKSNCTSSPRKVLTLNWIQSVSSIGIFEHRYPSHVCTRPNPTQPKQLNSICWHLTVRRSIFYCAQCG